MADKQPSQKFGLSGRVADLSQPTASSYIAVIRGMISLEF